MSLVESIFSVVIVLVEIIIVILVFSLSGVMTSLAITVTFKSLKRMIILD